MARSSEIIERVKWLGLIGFLGLFHTVFGQVDTSLGLKVFTITEQITIPSASYRVSHIDSLLFNRMDMYNVDDLLKRQSDLMVKDYGPGALSTVSMRGLSAHHTKIIWNGVPLNSGMNGTMDLSLLPTSAISQMNLYYGAGAIINGAGGLGGAVQIISEPDFHSPFTFSLNQGLETIGSSNTAIGLGFGKNKWFFKSGINYQASVNQFEYINPEIDLSERLTMKNADFQKFGFNQNIVFKPTKKDELAMSGILTSSDRNLPHNNLTNLVHEDQSDRLGIISGSYKRLFTNSALFIQTSATLNELSYRNSSIGLVSESREERSFNQIRYKFFIGPKIKIRSAAVLDYTRAFNLSYGDWQKQTQLSLINEAEIQVNERIQLNGLIKSLKNGSELFPILPSVGFNWEMVDHYLNWRLNSSIQASAPSLNDKYWGSGGNSELVSEQGWNAETGINGDLGIATSFVLTYELNTYYSETKNWIAWVPDETSLWSAQNIPFVTASGIEFKMNFQKQISDMAFKIGAWYNLNRTVNENNEQLIYVPKNRVGLNTEIRWQGLSLLFDQQVVGRRYILSNQSAFLPEYTQGNIKVGYEFAFLEKSKLKCAIYSKNVFDEPYQSIAHRPMPMRYFGLELNYMFR